jgi:phage repressor protein C with HTH and peptisase S24 domain
MDDNQMADIRRARLKEWMNQKRLNGTSLAAKLGTSRAYVSGVLNTDKHFGEKAARSIEQKLLMPKGYLDSDGTRMAPVSTWDKPEDLPEGVYALVPRIGVQLSAGDGVEAVSEDELPSLAFRESWLRKKHVTSRKNLRVLEVKGVSMEPYLHEGDVVLIDMGQSTVIDGEVYALKYGDELRIKRLSKRFDGGLIIRSDNPRYPEEVVAPMDMEHVQVLGLMIWRAG